MSRPHLLWADRAVSAVLARLLSQICRLQLIVIPAGCQRPCAVKRTVR
ncbi:MAG: hypothetical protein ACRDSP_13445 [Pseudonocardiaceae bacterium]